VVGTVGSEVDGQHLEALRRQLEANPEYVMDVLRDGGLRARAVAQQVMEEVREAAGLPTTR
jgi:hypothetical protein